MIAMHAGKGMEAHLHIGIGSLDFMDEIHPEFRSSELGILFSHNGNIILLPTSHHTSLTGRAFIQINHHSPSIHLILRIGEIRR
jgi:hypothetical protein